MAEDKRIGKPPLLFTGLAGVADGWLVFFEGVARAASKDHAEARRILTKIEQTHDRYQQERTKTC